ncbi:MAG: hypothetical protein OHK0012_20990 [Synechococcales cyanobacterium]
MADVPPLAKPLRRTLKAGDPWWYKLEYLQAQSFYAAASLGWQGWRLLNTISDAIGLTRAIYYRVALIYGLWALVTALPLFESVGFWQGWGLVAAFPMLLSWMLVACCWRQIPFPTLKRFEPEVRQWVQQKALLAVPQLLKHTVSGSRDHAAWVALHWWVCALMLLLSLLVQSFLLALTGLSLAVLGFVSLLFGQKQPGSLPTKDQPKRSSLDG